MKVTLIQATPQPLETIASIASICYDSRPKEAARLVRQLYLSGHHSVFEHIYFTFKIEGISRACSHQLVRYRHCSFTQRSQRYCGEDGFAFVQPPAAAADFSGYMEEADQSYQKLLDAGLAREDARYVLPNACSTDLYLSCNLRELIHIANERLCRRAQWEIRQLVEALCGLVDPELRWMLVPKCQSQLLICHDKCAEAK